MDFSLIKVFIVPPSNSLPSSGQPVDMSAGQFGVFRNDYSVATVGNIAAAPYIYMCQARPTSQSTLPAVGTKRSDKIYATKILEWYKVTAENNINVQIIDITDFSAKCSEDVTISVRIRSFYANTGFFNGLTRSYTITTPCCECGDDPCDQVDEEDLIDQFVTKINADVLVNKFIIAEKLVDGSDFKIRLTGKQVVAERTVADPSAYPYQYDRYKFWAWAYRGPETTQDFNVWDNCDPFATVTTLQEATYPAGSSAEIKQLEKDYWSMDMPPIAKPLFKWDIFNGGYTSQVVDGTFYDTYYIKFTNATNNDWNPSVVQDSMVILAVPTGESSTLETLLETYLGTVTDETGANISTTTTTTSTTTSTTTTTTSSTTTTTTTTP